MGKYDVDIMVKATDAVGPGLDSAAKKVGKFGSAVEDLAGRYVKFGGIEASFKGVSGVVDLLRGNTEDALRAFESLPFGIGPAVGALGGLFKAFSSTNEATERAAKLINDFQNALNKRSDEQKLDFLSGIDKQVEELRQKTQKEAAELRKQAYDAYQASRQASGDQAAALLYQSDQFYAEAERLTFGFEKAKQDLIDKFNKEESEKNAKAFAEFQKEAEAEYQAALKRQADFIHAQSAIQAQGVAEFNDAVAQMEAEQQAVIEARQKRSVDFGKFLADQQRDPEGRASLAAGTQSRFLTGAADVARDRMASEALQTQKASKELLSKAVTILDTIAKSPFGVKVGVL